MSFFRGTKNDGLENVSTFKTFQIWKQVWFDTLPEANSEFTPENWVLGRCAPFLVGIRPILLLVLGKANQNTRHFP